MTSCCTSTTDWRLEGPLQSWGGSGTWGDRPTCLYPTFSGVVGQIACAMGFERGSKEIVTLSKSLDMAVRRNRAGSVITDYQTVRGMFEMANGKKKTAPETRIRHKGMLSDASFTVAFTGDADLIEKIRYAINDPHWPLYLGRRTMIPSHPIHANVTNEYDSLLDALAHVDDVVPGEQYEVEVTADNKSAMYMNMDRIEAADYKSYSPRPIARKRVIGV